MTYHQFHFSFFKEFWHFAFRHFNPDSFILPFVIKGKWEDGNWGQINKCVCTIIGQEGYFCNNFWPQVLIQTRGRVSKTHLAFSFYLFLFSFFLSFFLFLFGHLFFFSNLFFFIILFLLFMSLIYVFVLLPFSSFYLVFLLFGYSFYILFLFPSLLVSTNLHHCTIVLTLICKELSFWNLIFYVHTIINVSSVFNSFS